MKGEKQLDYKDILNKKNVKNFIEGNINYLRQRSTFFKLPVHIQEQAVYRAMLCFDCLQLGRCKSCNCKTPESFYSPDNGDELGKWGPMLGMHDGTKYKQQHNIVIDPNIDLAKIELEYEFDPENLDAMLPWELRQVLGDLYEEIKELKKNEDEIQG